MTQTLKEFRSLPFLLVPPTSATPSASRPCSINPKTLDDVGPLMEAGFKRGYKNFNIKVAL
jgi:hypothetical protein